MLKRWWIYQHERFPLAIQGPLILLFSWSGVAYSVMLRDPDALPSLSAAVVAFLSCLIFFLQLRIADEFKDFEEDRQYRPYRPVPRGLVSLKELAIVFVMGALTQVALAWWLDPQLLLILLLAWGYLGFMSVEFFQQGWLKDHPLVYMLSHMVIMPIIHLYATSTDWIPNQGSASMGLIGLLLASFCNGMVLEIGRKIRSPADEETGVETYSALWGQTGAIRAWWIVLGLTWIGAGIAATYIQFFWSVAIFLGLILIIAGVIGNRFLRDLAPRQGKTIELVSGIWTLLLYFSLGVLPLIRRFIS